MNEQDRDQEFLQNVHKVLDESLDRIDGHAQSRLRQARNKALHGNEQKSWFQSADWLSAATVAAICVVVVTGILYLNVSSVNIPENGFSDVDLIASGESLELFEELEFYEWLQQEETGAG